MNNAKQYLMQVRLIDRRLRNVTKEIEAIREAYAETLRSPWPDGQPHGAGGKSDPVGEAAAALADQLRGLEAGQIRLRAKLWSIRAEVVNVIGRVPDADCNELLSRRYVEGQKWEQIALEMNFDYTWVAGGLHSKALKMVRDIIESPEKSNEIF